MNGKTATNVKVNVALWVVSIGVGVAFAAAGVTKLVLSKKHLVLLGAGWVEDFSPGTVRFVGFTEMMGGLAIILPAVLDVPHRLVLTAGTAGLIIVMLGAAVVHARRRESGLIVLNCALLALAAIALWGRPSY
jgi:DoxX-like family